MGWVPPSSVVFKILLCSRIISAFFNGITDCDESFNYWEPLHYLMYGYGFQTWEYSPAYALRSYAYLGLYGAVGVFWRDVVFYVINDVYFPFIYSDLEMDSIRFLSKIDVFLFIRISVAVVFALVETFFYRSLIAFFGSDSKISWLYVIISVFSPGMFIAGTAFLPSSFCMYTVMITYGALMLSESSAVENRDFYRAVTVVSVAVSVIVGWPFAAVLGLPVIISVVFAHQKFGLFVKYCVISLMFILLPCMIVDFYFYRKWTIPAVNIAVYNVFSGKGPELYGVEPLSFYFKNGFLNFNVAFVACFLSAPSVLFAYLICVLFDKSRSTGQLAKKRIPLLLDSLRELMPSSWCALFNIAWLPLLIWFGIFFPQPHKEERFLFPVYPLIALNASLFLSVAMFVGENVHLLLSSTLRRLKSQWIILAGFMMVFVFLSVSRSVALYRNFSAPLNVYRQMYESEMINAPSEKFVCVGKEWHQFGTHFLLPHQYKGQFIRSEFKGQLPGHFDQKFGTSIAPPYFNDNNDEESSRYVGVQVKS